MIAEAGYKDHHTKLVVDVSSAKVAKLICLYLTKKYGYVPDAVVVEGPLAGRHLGFKKSVVTNRTAVFINCISAHI